MGENKLNQFLTLFDRLGAFFRHYYKLYFMLVDQGDFEYDCCVDRMVWYVVYSTVGVLFRYGGHIYGRGQTNGP